LVEIEMGSRRVSSKVFLPEYPLFKKTEKRKRWDTFLNFSPGNSARCF